MPSLTDVPATVGELGERALIARIVARLPTQPWVVVGPGDDAAVIEPARRMLDVVTTDALVEGIHFDRRFCPPSAIGHKALAVNLSDLASMGAIPRAALLSMVLPADIPVSDVDAILDGMLAIAGRHHVALVGGNITRSPACRDGSGQGPLIIDVTAIGAVARRRLLTRAGARPGDDVYVTGDIGAGAAGLHQLRTEAVDGAARRGAQEEPAPGECAARYLRPHPRVRAGMLLGRNRAATSCIDLSDGLGASVWQVAEASNVGIAIDAERLPIHPDAKPWLATQGDLATSALSGGDDYELLFTVRPSHRGRLRLVRQQLGGLSVTRIGTVTASRQVVMRTPQGVTEIPRGFEHFR